MPGYSGTPLARKLGIKMDTTVLTVKAPSDLESWLDPLPASVRIGPRYRTADVVLVFATTIAEMKHGAERAMRTIPLDGTIWLCWPKKSSGIESDLQSRDTMMGHMLLLGLVDVKVAAVSDVWSGLKFAIRKQVRQEVPRQLPEPEQVSGSQGILDRRSWQPPRR